MRFFLILTMLAFSVTAFAQMGDIEAQFTWGMSEKAPSGSRIARIVSANSQGLQVLRYQPSQIFSGENYSLEHYNERFNLINRSELLLPEDVKVDVEDLFTLDNQLFLLSSKPHIADQSSRLTVRPISPNGQLLGDEYLLADMSLDDKYRRRQFDLEFNRDSSLFLLYNQVPTEDGENEQFTLRVYDDQFQLQWSRDITLDYADNQFKIVKYQIDGQGNIVVLGQLRGSTPLYVIFTYTDDGRKEATHELGLETGFLHHVRFELSETGQLFCSGSYSEATKLPLSGVCFFRINLNTENWSPVWLIDYPDEPLNTNTCPSHPGMRYILKKLIPRSDGGCVVILEEAQRTVRRASPYWPPIIRLDFGNILVMNIDPEGHLDWSKCIPKYQSVEEDRLRVASFAHTTIEDRFYFIYNDHPKNFSPDKSRTYAMEGHESVVVLTEITRAGEITTIPLPLNERLSGTILPRMCRQINSRQMLIYGETGRKHSFGLLSFE